MSTEPLLPTPLLSLRPFQDTPTGRQLMADSGLNSEQLDAATHTGSHLLLLAGAGSGKTKTLVSRLVYLLRCGADPKRILLLTFTRKAANEMKERAVRDIGLQVGDVTAGTFHYFCLLAMRRRPDVFSLAPSTTIIDSSDQENLIKLLIGKHETDDMELPKASEILSWISYARNSRLRLAGYLSKFTAVTDEQSVAIQFLARDYADKKRELRYLDYDDLLEQYLETLIANPAALASEKARFDHILVDEMQDTNPVQMEILQMLHEPAQLFCVGDDAQSIYMFRGADYRNVHEFTEKIANAAVKKLVVNYRSNQEILDLSNWLLGCSSLRYGKELIAHRGSAQRCPTFKVFRDEFEEARWICQDILKKRAVHSSWSSFMVLCRASHLLRPLDALLTEARIPHQLIGGPSLMESAHVKDVLSLVRVAANPADELAWARFLMLWPKIGQKTAYKTIEMVRLAHDQADALQKLATVFGAGHDLVEAYEYATGEPTAVGAFRSAARAMETLLSEKKSYSSNWKRRKKDLELLEKLALSHPTVQAFLDAYTVDAPEKSAESTDLVTLITVHSAKGTEAEVCYLLQAQPGVYPYRKSVGDTESEEEERRILYVAMTRAKDHLMLTRTPAKPDDDELPCFFDDLPRDLVTFVA